MCAERRHASARTRHTPLGLERCFSTTDSGDFDHASFFQNRTENIEIDPKSIHVDMDGPHPDRPPPELLKNHHKSRKSQYFRYFSKLCAVVPPATSQNDQQHPKYSFFSGDFNWPSNYADLELNPLRLVKSNVGNFQNMQRKNVTTCKVTVGASLQVIQNLFLSAFEIFLATSKCQFTYV